VYSVSISYHLFNLCIIQRIPKRAHYRKIGWWVKENTWSSRLGFNIPYSNGPFGYLPLSFLLFVHRFDDWKASNWILKVVLELAGVLRFQWGSSHSINGAFHGLSEDLKQRGILTFINKLASFFLILDDIINQLKNSSATYVLTNIPLPSYARALHPPPPHKRCNYR